MLFGPSPHWWLAYFLYFWHDERISMMKDFLEKPQVLEKSSLALLSYSFLPDCLKAILSKLSFGKECVIGVCFKLRLQWPFPNNSNWGWSFYITWVSFLQLLWLWLFKSLPNQLSLIWPLSILWSLIHLQLISSVQW